MKYYASFSFHDSEGTFILMTHVFDSDSSADIWIDVLKDFYHDLDYTCDISPYDVIYDF